MSQGRFSRSSRYRCQIPREVFLNRDLIMSTAFMVLDNELKDDDIEKRLLKHGILSTDTPNYARLIRWEIKNIRSKVEVNVA